MEGIVMPFALQNDGSKHRTTSKNIGNEFTLLEDFSNLPLFMHPFKMDVLAVMVCTQGAGEGTIDMYPYNLTAPFVVIIRPDQIIHYEYLSDDFSGYCLLLSNRFSSDFLLDTDNSLPIVSAIREKPFAQLNNEDLKPIRRYFSTLKMLMSITDNPYRLEMVKHLTMVYFYLTRPYFQIFTEAVKQTKHTKLIDDFTQLLRENYRYDRKTAFYADKLNLTPKYLSQLIKSATGKSASDWVEDFVMLEAKALLKSTNMTVQQISDELNFPSQSTFGKYFKRVEGISPKEYREKE